MAVVEVRAPFVGLSVGDTFSSFEELKTKIISVQDNSHLQLSLRDSRTIAGMEKTRAPAIAAKCNRDLKYHSLTYMCVFGGKIGKQQLQGLRANSKTLKQNCKSQIKIGLTKDCQQLEVKMCEEIHNHEVSSEVYNHLPRQRRIDSEDLEEAQKLLLLKGNKKLIQQHLQVKTGKFITLKDVSNIKANMSKTSPGNSIPDMVEKLSQEEGSFVEVFSKDNVLSGVLFQDKTMKNMYSRFPEIVLLDATYKLTQLRMALYLLMIIDGDGQSQVVAMYLTCSEEKASLTEMVKSFKAANTAWIKTVVFMTDKDMTERSVLSSEFPQAYLQLCLFHVLRCFKREFTIEKMGIHSGVRDRLLELLSEMANAKHEKQFEKSKKQFYDMNILSANEFFEKNWLPIKTEWVRYLKDAHFTLGEQTNNRLESMNAKIKSVCSKYASLDTFFTEFFTVLKVLRGEREHTSLMSRIKRPSKVSSITECEVTYMQHTTAYAFKMIQLQMSLSTKVKITSGINHVTSSEGKLNLSATSCECSFWKTCQLPCRHIMAYRKFHDFPLFDTALVAERWTSEYSTHPDQQCPTKYSGHKNSVSSPSVQSALSFNQKYRKIMKIAQDLASLSSEVGMATFNERVAILSKMRDSWQSSDQQQAEETNNQDTLNGADFEQPCDIIAACNKPQCVSCKRETKYVCITCSVVVCAVCSSPELDDETDGWIVGRSVGYCKSCIKTIPTESSTSNCLPSGTSSVAMLCENDLPLDTIDATDIAVCCTTDRSTVGWAPLSAPLKEQLSNIKLPTAMKRRGRPKGAELTVVGLPKKRKRCGVVKFSYKMPNEKEKIMLTWFTAEGDADDAIRGKQKLDEKHIKIQPRTAACNDENVCLDAIKKYFTRKAWIMIEAIQEKLLEDGEDSFFCSVCTNGLNSKSIMCDSCLQWVDFKCAGLTAAPKCKAWFCRACRVAS